MCYLNIWKTYISTIYALNNSPLLLSIIIKNFFNLKSHILTFLLRFAFIANTWMGLKIKRTALHVLSLVLWHDLHYKSTIEMKIKKNWLLCSWITFYCGMIYLFFWLPSLSTYLHSRCAYTYTYLHSRCAYTYTYIHICIAFAFSHWYKIK